jgi:hypothetical protein
MTKEEYYERLEAQNGGCAICGATETESKGHKAKFDGSGRLSVDHCHSTGRIRGLLCAECNRALGLFKDSLNVLRSAVRYMETH